jgi:hypothetical protein
MTPQFADVFEKKMCLKNLCKFSIHIKTRTFKCAKKMWVMPWDFWKNLTFFIRFMSKFIWFLSHFLKEKVVSVNIFPDHNYMSIFLNELLSLAPNVVVMLLKIAYGS